MYPIFVQIYWAGLFMSTTFALVAGFLVYTCYPDEDKVLDENQKPVHYIARLVKFCLCRNKFLLKHFANDWLACCWGFFLGSTIWAFGSFCFIFTALNTRQYFVYGSSLLDGMLFTIGSAYFVAGAPLPAFVFSLINSALFIKVRILRRNPSQKSALAA